MRTGYKSNAKQVSRDIKQLESKVLKKALGVAVTAGSKVFRDNIKMYVPIRTGRLRRAIKSRTLKGKNAYGREVEGISGVIEGGKDWPFYARFIEEGFNIVKVSRYAAPLKRRLRRDTKKAVPETTKKGKRQIIRRVMGRPFLRRAFESSQQKVVGTFDDKVTKKLAAEWAKVGK